MNARALQIGAVLLMGLIFFAGTVRLSLYTVAEHERVLLTRLGEPVGEVEGAGLHLKMPLVDQPQHLDGRLQRWTRELEVPTRELEVVVVRASAVWVMSDPLSFHVTVRTPADARSRISDILDSLIRDRITSASMADLFGPPGDSELSGLEARAASIRDEATEHFELFGLELLRLDVRVSWLESLHPQVEDRMFQAFQREVAEASAP